MKTKLRFEIRQAEEAIPQLSKLAALRMEVFKEWPYLYDGTAAYEEKYLHRYTQCPDFHLILAWDGEACIGASSCLPMEQEDESIRKNLRDAGLEEGQFFYLGESVLKKEYRGKGIGKAFFTIREEIAAKYSLVQKACFCAVERAIDHPLRPADYRPLHEFWKNQGYQDSELFAKLIWKDIHQKEEDSKALRFWFKSLKK